MMVYLHLGVIWIVLAVSRCGAMRASGGDGQAIELLILCAVFYPIISNGKCVKQKITIYLYCRRISPTPPSRLASAQVAEEIPQVSSDPSPAMRCIVHFANRMLSCTISAHYSVKSLCCMYCTDSHFELRRLPPRTAKISNWSKYLMLSSD